MIRLPGGASIASLLCIFVTLSTSPAAAGTLVDPAIAGDWVMNEYDWRGHARLTTDGVLTAWLQCWGEVCYMDTGRFNEVCEFAIDLTKVIDPRGRVVPINTILINTATHFRAFGSNTHRPGCEDTILRVDMVDATPTRLHLFMSEDLTTGFIPATWIFKRLNPSTSVDAREAKAGMWNSPLGSGWGLSLVVGKTAERIPFVVLYVYDDDRVPTWYVMPSGVWSDDNHFQGDLYAMTGTPWHAPSFNSDSVTTTKVGTVSMQFSSDNEALLTYSIKEGESTTERSSPMVKQDF